MEGLERNKTVVVAHARVCVSLFSFFCSLTFFFRMASWLFLSFRLRADGRRVAPALFLPARAKRPRLAIQTPGRVLSKAAPFQTPLSVCKRPLSVVLASLFKKKKSLFP